MQADSCKYEFVLDNLFFANIDGPEVQKGKVNVVLVVKKTSRAFELNFQTDGMVWVPCDRCLDDMEQPVSSTDKLLVKFGHEYAEEGDNLIVIPEEEGEINVAWFMYEFIALAIPMKHVHAPGKCNKAMSSKLTCTGEGDLAGGGEHEHTVLRAVLLALVQQNRSLDDLLGQVVDDVSLIPEDLEIRSSGLHLGHPVNGLIAVSIAIRVGILGHAPDALDGVILGHQLLHNVHIGAIGGHGHADQLKAVLLSDGKVAVIAGHRAEELALFHLRPGAGRLREAEHIANVDEVVHQLQAGVAAHEHFLGLDTEHIRKQDTSLVQALKITIVANTGRFLSKAPP